MTSGKYGPNILPATIEAEEYEAIFAELTQEFNLLRSHIEGLQQEQKDIDEEKEKNEHTDGENIKNKSSEYQGRDRGYGGDYRVMIREHLGSIRLQSRNSWVLLGII